VNIHSIAQISTKCKSRRDLMSLYRRSYEYYRRDCEICQGLVEILCVGLRVLWQRWGLTSAPKSDRMRAKLAIRSHI
jgi:hypothetical protein